MNELCHVVSYYFSPCVVIFCCAEEMKTHDSDLVAGLAADSVLEVHKVQVRTLGCLNKILTLQVNSSFPVSQICCHSLSAVTFTFTSAQLALTFTSL